MTEEILPTVSTQTTVQKFITLKTEPILGNNATVLVHQSNLLGWCCLQCPEFVQP